MQFSISGKKRSILPTSRSNNGLRYPNISILIPRNGDVEEQRPQTDAASRAVKFEEAPLKIPREQPTSIPNRAESQAMPAIIVIGIVFSIMLTGLTLLLMFIQVAFVDVPQQTAELSPEQARQLIRRVSHHRVNPADQHSPTIEQLLRRSGLEQFLQTPARSSAE